MNVLKVIASVGIAAVIAGCAQQEEITMVAPEPVFDKFGGGSCEEGYIYVPGAAFEPSVCVPEDECEGIVNADGSEVPCPPPPPGRDDDDDDDDSSSGRDPTGAPGTPSRC